MYDIAELRRTEFPLSAHTIYFNHGSISPVPTRVKVAVQETVEALAANPAGFFHDTFQPLMAELPTQLAELIHAARPEEIALINNTSYGLNSIAQSIPWQPGDNVLFYHQEFPSNAYPWMNLRHRGVEARLVPGEAGLALENLEPLVDSRTRLISVSSVQFFTGHRSDLAAIGQFCADREILFVVDAIQSIGHIPVDVQELGIHALVSGGQKSILALPGIGFMYVRASRCQSWQPAFVGSGGTENYLHWLEYDLTPLPAAGRFSMGTPNIPGIAGLHAALSLLRECGVDNIDRHTQALSRFAINALKEMDYQVLTPPDACGPIVTFHPRLNNEETDVLVAHLAEENIIVVKRRDPAGNPYVRLSFHCYNTMAEIEQFGRVLAAL